MASRVRRGVSAAVLVVVGLGLLVLPAGASGRKAAQQAALERYPDLQTVVPRQLQLVNAHQREVLRFSNGIANTGGGPWQMRPRFPLDPSGRQTQDAIQEIVDPSGQVLESRVVSQFAFHPSHNHWHIDGVALFEVREGAPDGPVFGGNSVKTTFCLVDWYALEGHSRTPDRTFWDCGASSAAQGISVGWVDQYNQSVDGQSLDITGADPEVLYFLVSTANPDGAFLERDPANNTAWASFRVRRDSSGNPKLELVGRSACEGPLCGDKAPNR